jgi:hypothetical protein
MAQPTAATPVLWSSMAQGFGGESGTDQVKIVFEVDAKEAASLGCIETHHQTMNLMEEVSRHERLALACAVATAAIAGYVGGRGLRNLDLIRKVGCLLGASALGAAAVYKFYQACGLVKKAAAAPLPTWEDLAHGMPLKMTTKNDWNSLADQTEKQS